MATDEDNTDSTITATPEVHFIPTIVLGDAANAPALREIVPVPEDISNITSGEKLNSSVFGDAFNAFSDGDPATSFGSTTVFVNTFGSKVTSTPGDYTTGEGDSTLVPEDVINSAHPFSDPEEVFQTSFKETFPISSETITVLSEGVTDNLSTVDTSTISNTFSAMFQLPSTVVFGNTVSLSDGNNTAVEGLYTTSGSRGKPIEGNKTECESRDIGWPPSATIITSPGGIPNASTDGNLNTSGNMTTAVSVGTIQYVSTTGSGNTFAITVGENATASGNIPTTHLETDPFNEPVSVIPGNVTSIASAGGATTVKPKNMTIAPVHIQTMAAVEIPTNPGNASSTPGETATVLSSGDVTMTAIPCKEAITDSENFTITMTPSSISGIGNPKATQYIADTDSGDSITTIAAAPGSAIQTSAHGKDSNIITGEVLSTTLLKACEETTTIVSFQESTANFVPVVARTTDTQGNAFSSMDENVTSCESSVEPEDAVGTTSDNNTTIGDKVTVVDFGENTVTSSSGETVATSQGIQTGTNNGGNTSLEESITAVLGPTSSDDLIPGVFSFSNGKPLLDSTSTHGDISSETIGPGTTSTHNTEQEISTNALDDATSTSTSDFAFINKANKGSRSTDPNVSPRSASAAASIPCDTTTSALGETVPVEERITSGNAKSMITPLGEASDQPGSHSNTEATTSTVSFSIIANAIHGDTECIAASQNLSSNKCIPPEDTSAITTNSTSSPENITPLDSDRPDEAVTSGKININFCSEPLRPRAITASAEDLIFEDVATNASGDSNTPDNITHFPENAAATIAEVAAIVSGNNSTAPENPLNNTTLGKSNYNFTRVTSTTMQGALNIAAGRSPTAKPKETIDTNMTENSASTPRQIKTAPEDDLIIAQEKSTIVSSKITDETPVATRETSAPEWIPTVTSEETNIAILGETTNPTAREATIALGEIVALSPGETPETTDTSRDISTSMGQKKATTYEDASAASENTLIGTPRKEVFSCSVEIPASDYDVTIIIHRKTSKTRNTARSGLSSAICPGETPTTVSAKATTIHREASPTVIQRNVPIAHTPKESLMAVPKEITSVFQGKISTVNPVVSPPYWFILFLGFLLMIVLVVVGLCMVI
ncbi:mucin-22 [Tiliqua scincoides]|uniref:mucin-22 n=1 Tax=Tiliqua scincoides TaxID=71010 RepID=UPI003461D868